MVKRVFCKAYLLLIILSNISLSVYSQKAVEKDLSFHHGNLLPVKELKFL